jgi:hypothetical protein
LVDGPGPIARLVCLHNQNSPVPDVLSRKAISEECIVLVNTSRVYPWKQNRGQPSKTPPASGYNAILCFNGDTEPATLGCNYVMGSTDLVFYRIFNISN